MFVSPFNLLGTGPAQLLILDETGVPLFQRKFRSQPLAHDFKIQPNGLLTFYMDPANKFYVLDGTYAIVDSLAIGVTITSRMCTISSSSTTGMLIMGLGDHPVDTSSWFPAAIRMRRWGAP